MKTTSAISALAFALPAFAAPAPAATSSAAGCPGINRAEFFSNNNIQYSVSCGTDYSTKVLRTTQTEVGVQGCLTACDGTINCTAVTFVPSDSTNLKGFCYSRTTGAGHATKNSAVLVANRISPAPTSTITALAPTSTPTTASTTSAASSVPTFGGVAIRSGSEIQYASVNANGTYFWLHRGSETYTPSSVDETNQQNNTLFVGGNGGLSLLTSVPGGQEVYVDSKGLLRFTVPHSANTGTDSKTTGFSITDGHLQFEGNDFLACNLGEAYGNAYEIYAASGSNTGDACEGFAFRTANSTGPAAYEYA